VRPFVQRAAAVRAVAVLAAGLAFLAAGVAPVRAAEDGGPPPVAVTCEHPVVPGRVRCELEAQASAGESIAWGDAVLVGVPAFATALRGRIGPADALERTPERWRWAFALVARERGHGDLAARVRLVVCRGSTCAAREVPVSGRVSVGPEN
jgi:hypothetical protein